MINTARTSCIDSCCASHQEKHLWISSLNYLILLNLRCPYILPFFAPVPWPFRQDSWSCPCVRINPHLLLFDKKCLSYQTEWHWAHFIFTLPVSKFHFERDSDAIFFNLKLMPIHYVMTSLNQAHFVFLLHSTDNRKFPMRPPAFAASRPF